MAAGTKDEEKKREVRRLEKALRHPMRTRLRRELEDGFGPVELAAGLDQPLRWVTYHYRVLEAVGGLPTEGIGQG